MDDKVIPPAIGHLVTATATATATADPQVPQADETTLPSNKTKMSQPNVEANCNATSRGATRA